VYKRVGESLSDRLIEGTQRFGGGSVMMLGCMFWEGPGHTCRIDGRMGGEFTDQSQMRIFMLAWSIVGNILQILYFSRIMTPNTRVRRLLSGFLTMVIRSSYGQHSLLMQIPLKIFEVMSKDSYLPMKPPK
jgi:hypothetical protein